MKMPVYRELLKVMQSRRGPYAGLDIPEFFDLAEELFLPEEAEVDNALSRSPETREKIAQRLNRDSTEIGRLLDAMAGKELCATFTRAAVQAWYFRVPFYCHRRMIPGTAGGHRSSKLLFA